MSHPMKAAGHKNDPKWLENLNKYKEKDLSATARNYSVDEKITGKAAYEPASIKEK